MLCVSWVGIGWAEKIAFLIPERFVAGLDNPPAAADVPLVWESLEIGTPDGGLPEVGLFALAKRLESQGHSITFYGTDSDDAASVIADNDLVFISEAIGSGSVVTGTYSDYYLSPKPVITTESYVLDNFFLATASSPFTGGANTNRLKVVDPNHAITKGLPPSFFFTVKDEVTNEPAIVTIGTVRDESILVEGVGHILVRIDGPGPSADTDIQPPDDAVAVMVVDKGEKSIEDEVFPARFVFIGYSDVAPGEEFGGDPESKTFALLSDTGWQLWDNAFNWALGKPTPIEEWEIH
jgi:hypothetical protein